MVGYSRFGESHGFEQDYIENLHFTTEILSFVPLTWHAGDELPDKIAGDELALDDPMAMIHWLLGAGYIQLKLQSVKRRERNDAMDDMLGTIGSAMLATTIACKMSWSQIWSYSNKRLLNAFAFTTTVRSDIDIVSSMNPNSDQLKGKISLSKTHLKLTSKMN